MSNDIKTESDKKISKDERIGYSLLILIILIITIGLLVLAYLKDNNIIIHPAIGMLIAIGILILVLFLWFESTYYIESKGCHQENVVIDSKIVSVKPVMGKENWDKDIIRFLDVSFSNGKNYLIDFDKHLDLTVNSKLILGLHRHWRYDKILSKGWRISNIIKVP